MYQNIYFDKIENIDDYRDLIMNFHYAHRMPSVSFAYGLFYNDKLMGVVTYGQPASRTLQTGFFGKEHAHRVIELNRLYIKDEVSQTIPNITSEFVAWSLKQLKPYNKAVVSFSDLGMSHSGGIYRATNFMYLGKTPARTDKFSGFGKHSRHYDKEAKEVLRVYRTQKMKYLYLAMDKTHKKQYMKLLKYPVLEYPKEKIFGQHYKPGDTEPVYYKDMKTGNKITEQEAKEILKNEWGVNYGPKRDSRYTY